MKTIVIFPDATTMGFGIREKWAKHGAQCTVVPVLLVSTTTVFTVYSLQFTVYIFHEITVQSTECTVPGNRTVFLELLREITVELN